MIEVKKEGVLLEPTSNEFENSGVLNPSIVQKGDDLHLFYRAVQAGNKSSIGYAKLSGPMKIVERYSHPVIVPEHEYESQGVEDPRIVWFEEDQAYYLFYAAYDGKNARGAYAVSKDLKTFEKKGLVTPPIPYERASELLGHMVIDRAYYEFAEYMTEYRGDGTVLLWEKDHFLLPKKINGKYAMIHRILPDIQVIYFDKFEDLTNYHFWEHYLAHLSDYIVLKRHYLHESRNIGGGAPLIELSEGYLMIYHAVENTTLGKVYHAGAALLHKDDPTHVIGQLDHPLFSPTEEWEKKGEVGNVVFPTGTARFDDRIYVYYGAADSRIGVASFRYHDLLEELMG